MAITGPTLVNGSWFNTANSNPYLTSAGTNPYTVQLVSGRRYFLVVESFSAGAAESITSVIHDPTGTPLNFALVTDGTTSAAVTGFGQTGNVFEVWSVDVTSTTATAAIQITFGGTQSACGAGLFYVTGHDPTTPFPQVVVATDATANTTPSATLASFAASDSLTLVAICRDDTSGGITPTESRTELYENAETERNNHALHYQHPNGADTSVGATLNINDDWAVLAIEVAAASTGITGTAALTIVPGAAASGTQSHSGTAALTILPVVGASGTQAHTGTAALTLVPGVVGSGTVAAGGITGTAALVILPASGASGDVAITGSAALTVVPAVVGDGMQGHSGAAALTVTPGLSSAGEIAITGTGALALVPGTAAAGTQAHTGDAALTVVPVVAGTGTVTVTGVITGTADLVIAFGASGSAGVEVWGTAALAILPAADGYGYSGHPTRGMFVPQGMTPRGFRGGGFCPPR